CASMEAYYQAQNHIPDSHVYEKTDDYLIRAFDDGRYTLYFLAGENNTICTITIDQPELSAEECARLLLEYRDKLGTE
ncbi:MAG: hypothetical protein IJY74_02955, partial [Oscillospiraceae bacterium]|nr:hypothetical protein [Oscillospiraceae bacterium]